MTSALKRQDDGTIELTITIPTKKVKTAYDKALVGLTKTTEIKGFRKGKAPTKMVEQKLGKSKIYEEVLKTLVTESYLETVKEHSLKPIVNPKVNIVSMEEGKDWQFTATVCELPKFSLGDYKESVKKALASEKIWVPGKDDKTDEKKTENQEERLGKVFQTLLKAIKITVPGIMVEDEVNRSLSKLIDQTARLGVTVEQYLASIDKTAEQLRAEYQKQAEEQMKLELILSAIADKEKIEVKDEEINKMIKAVPDEKAQKSMDTPAQRAYIKQVLRKRTVIDKLAKL